MSKFKYEKYVIKKGKTDLVSSLKALDKKLLKEKLEELDLENVKELADYMIDEFEFLLDVSKEDIFTRMFFQRLLENENSPIFSAYEQDVEFLNVFVYENGGFYSYYIPDEIKIIIKKILNF